VAVSIPVALVIAPAPAGAEAAEFRIAVPDDDAREAGTTVVVTTERFLPIGHNDLVARRFAGVSIPQGAGHLRRPAAHGDQ
jgi:hypothetical protein